MKLVECIPNVSEGRRPAVVGALAAVFASRPRVRLLHTHSDVDHNRTVFTTVGEPAALLDAIAALYAVALEHIDLRGHDGAHPRIGAVDVCPFVPLPEHGTEMQDCVALARRLGARLGGELSLPVFLYREAATTDERRDLSAIRRGQFEGLAGKLADDAWQPDFGPSTPHRRGGATVVGARGPLIAYNMVLDSAELPIAKEIAAQVRASSGGFPGVKAIGVELVSRDLVQVSMNIEDPVATPLEVVSEAVGEAAIRLGTEVRETELVGLIPRAFATPAALRWLSRGDFDSGLILEEAIAASARGSR